MTRGSVITNQSKQVTEAVKALDDLEKVIKRLSRVGIYTCADPLRAEAVRLQAWIDTAP